MNRIKELESGESATTAYPTTAYPTSAYPTAANRDYPLSSSPRRASILPNTRLVDFYELIKPRMNLLVVATTLVGYYMAASSTADWKRLPIALLGTALCAASASILNQLVERRYDALMDRTANRPLPTGRITPSEAKLLGIATGLAGGLCLYLMINPLTAALGIGTVLLYVLVYTPLKRRTVYNTIIGAIPGAIPPVMGFTAVTGKITPGAIALFLILFIWQIPHFLAIATLYRDDYRRGGFAMLPVNDRNLLATSRHILLFSAALVPVSLGPTIIKMTGAYYFIWASILGLIFLKYALTSATRRSRADARNLFFVSIIYLPVLMALMMIDRM